MKILKYNALILLLFTIALLGACEKQTEESETDESDYDSGSADTGKMPGTWVRNDGQAIAYIRFEGSTATTCVNGVMTAGTFSVSASTATFVVGGQTIVFPLQMSGTKLIVKVPAQGNANHVPTEYIKSTNWPCGATGGGNNGGGNNGGGGTAAKGTILVWSNAPENGFIYGFNSMFVTVAGSNSTIYGGHYTSAPSCGATYCFTKEVAPGTYTVTGAIYPLKPLSGPTPPTYTTSQTVTVAANQCTKVNLK